MVLLFTHGRIHGFLLTMVLLGNVAENKKISYSFHQDHLGVHLVTSHWMHLHTFVDRERKRSKER